MSAKKLVKCDVCDGRGRKIILHNGTVIDSHPCMKCKSTGKIPKPKK